MEFKRKILLQTRLSYEVFEDFKKIAEQVKEDINKDRSSKGERQIKKISNVKVLEALINAYFVRRGIE